MKLFKLLARYVWSGLIAAFIMGVGGIVLPYHPEAPWLILLWVPVIGYAQARYWKRYHDVD